MPLYITNDFVFPTVEASRIYSTVLGSYTTGVAVPAVDTIYFYPFPVAKTLAVTSIKSRVVSAGAGSAMKVGIWAHSSNGPVGAPLMADNTGVATTGNGNISLAASGTLSPGLYWVGSKFTGTLPQMTAMPSASQQLAWFFGAPSNSSTFLINAISMADTYSNNMPTIGAAQAFTVVASSGVPVVGLAT